MLTFYNILPFQIFSNTKKKKKDKVILFFPADPPFPEISTN